LYASFAGLLLTWLRNDFNAATTFGLYYSIPAILALAYITDVGRDLGPLSESRVK
jgi:hypothetical protein